MKRSAPSSMLPKSLKRLSGQGVAEKGRQSERSGRGAKERQRGRRREGGKGRRRGEGRERERRRKCERGGERGEEERKRSRLALSCFQRGLESLRQR